MASIANIYVTVDRADINKNAHRLLPSKGLDLDVSPEELERFQDMFADQVYYLKKTDQDGTRHYRVFRKPWPPMYTPNYFFSDTQ